MQKLLDTTLKILDIIIACLTIYTIISEIKKYILNKIKIIICI